MIRYNLTGSYWRPSHRFLRVTKCTIISVRGRTRNYFSITASFCEIILPTVFSSNWECPSRSVFFHIFIVIFTNQYSVLNFFGMISVQFRIKVSSTTKHSECIRTHCTTPRWGWWRHTRSVSNITSRKELSQSTRHCWTRFASLLWAK